MTSLRNAETGLYELGGRAFYDMWLENYGSREVRLMAIERRFAHAHRSWG